MPLLRCYHRMPDASPHSLHINDLVRAAKDFEKRLAQVKQTCGHEVEPGWYPYSTFANLPVIEKLLTGEHRDLSRMIAGGTVLDIGAGDGDLSYFLESQSV